MTKQNEEQMPIGSAEDVEYSEELADRDDEVARQRAEAADRRAVADERE